VYQVGINKEIEEVVQKLTRPTYREQSHLTNPHFISLFGGEKIG